MDIFFQIFQTLLRVILNIPFNKALRAFHVSCCLWFTNFSDLLETPIQI